MKEMRFNVGKIITRSPRLETVIMTEKTWYKLLKIKTHKKINSMEDVIKYLLKQNGYKLT